MSVGAHGSCCRQNTQEMAIKPPWKPELDGTPPDLRYVDSEFAEAEPTDSPVDAKVSGAEEGVGMPHVFLTPDMLPTTTPHLLLHLLQGKPGKKPEHFDHFTYVLRSPSGD